MKILHTADWHIGKFPGPVDNKGNNQREYDTYACIDYMADYARNKLPDLILISGDIFHQARVWADRGIDEVQTAIHVISSLSDAAPVVVMRGTPNHDGAEQFHALQSYFENSPDVYVVTEPKTIQVAGINVSCLPGFDRGVFRAKYPGLSKEDECQVFTQEISKIVLGLRAQCQPGLKSVLMAHYTVPGCNTESGQTQFFSQFEPVLMPETLDTAGYDLVALGHIHRPQQLESCRNTFYCGSINAMNFNDEGQQRGFYIHDLDAGTHDFITTPARQFETFRFTQTDIDGINAGAIADVANNYFGSVKGEIVRVLYSCSESAHKAFNRAVLEDRLYQDGAFWVSSIEPEKVEIGTNKDELSEKTDPEKNLLHYLKEKGILDEQVASIIEAARPIIEDAMEGNMAARYTGAFVPMDISVKNYRNYEEESFDFTDISFCTINGINGAGKSSLFMDAILDCLFEEPREGDLTGWIRADEKAHSGSICFTFSIGEHVFRVTRTRTKSGKATLNISEAVNGEWRDRSREKIKDTQSVIENVIGMDSLTFRSCALIMQDQYGLFLQASKEDRMTILGNILGLSVYEDMAKLAKDEVTDTNREIAQKKAVITNLSENGRIAEHHQSITDVINQLEIDSASAKKELDEATKRKDAEILKLAQCKEAAERKRKIDAEYQDVTLKMGTLSKNVLEEKAIVEDADKILSAAATIHAEAARLPKLTEQEKTLLQQQATLKTKCEATAALKSQLAQNKAKAEQLLRDKERTDNNILQRGREWQEANACKEDAAAYAAIQPQISEMENREKEYREAKSRLDTTKSAFIDVKSSFDIEAARRKQRVEHLQSRAKLLKDSQCVDPENAQCRFLADAKAAKKELETYVPQCTTWKNEQLNALGKNQEQINVLTSALNAVGYNADTLTQLRQRADSLRAKADMYKQAALYDEMLKSEKQAAEKIETDITVTNADIAKLQKQLSDSENLDSSLTEIDKQLFTLKASIMDAHQWIEKEKKLPAAEERKKAAEKRIGELNKEVSECSTKQLALKQESNKMLAGLEDEGDLSRKAGSAMIDVKIAQDKLNELNKSLGVYEEQLRLNEKTQEEIKRQQKQVNMLAQESETFSILKSAFSQDGIPHNIIKSMLPMLTSTANTILGQMTGGRMGMEFITDKVLKSNSKKEVATLDIIINEYGKDSLPYLSKSGGEKVKASLSAVLSLAEIKSSQAGIQLGMLFIDEPPFLDADGIQAYCDALQTIQSRYSSLKVMAITHDPEMKSRFPQSIDIVKDASGSHVLTD